MSGKNFPEQLKITPQQEQALEELLLKAINDTNYAQVFTCLSDIIRKDMDDYVEGEGGVTDEDHMEHMQLCADTLDDLADKAIEDAGEL